MDPEIKIIAHLEATRPHACRLAVDRVVHEGSVFFPTWESARGSALAEKIFEVEGIAAVRIAGQDVTVHKSGVEDWKPVAKKIAEVIRGHLRSGEPAVSKDYQPQRLPDEELKRKVQAVFDAQINPAVAMHGGMVRLVEVKDAKVYVQMGGGCQGCGMASATLRQGVEETLREQIPQIEEILDVTDHAAGSNPYYSP